MDLVVDGVPFRRVYHYHVRKTAGTSLNSAFWGLAGLDLSSVGPDARIERGDYVFVRGHPELIAEGEYFFANSHIPAYAIDLPDATFTVTFLRDPVRRLTSLYRYLLWVREHADDEEAAKLEPYLFGLVEEAEVLGDSFQDFLHRLEPDQRSAQLAMFSADLDPDEAAERVGAVHFVGMTETFPADIARLASLLGLPLEERNERRFGAEVRLTGADIEAARELMAPETAFIERVQRDRQRR